MNMKHVLLLCVKYKAMEAVSECAARRVREFCRAVSGPMGLGLRSPWSCTEEPGPLPGVISFIWTQVRGKEFSEQEGFYYVKIKKPTLRQKESWPSRNRRPVSWNWKHLSFGGEAETQGRHSPVLGSI